MDGNILTYPTEHFKFYVPIGDWNKNKIPLPEGVGGKFIAPSNIEAELTKPLYYEWDYETDGRINFLSPTLVYDKDWVGKKISHFPYCKELFKFLDWLSKEHGWHIPVSWWSFYRAVKESIWGIRSYRVPDWMVVSSFQITYNLDLSGYVREGKLRISGEGGYFMQSVGRRWPDGEHCLAFSSCCVDIWRPHDSDTALSVRCVTYSDS